MDKNEKARRMEEERMKGLASMLGNLSTQIHNNSYVLDKGIRDLTTKLKNKKNRSIEVRPARPAYKDIIDLVETSKKIPIVTYENKPCDARLYFSDIYKETHKIRRKHKD